MTDSKLSLHDYGLSDTNTPINKDRLLYRLSEACGGRADDIYKVLSDNPDRDKDKKAIMKRTERDSSITSTTGQGLGSVIDNMPYYVDSSAWWIKGFDADKYLRAKERASNNRSLYIDTNHLNRKGDIITRRRRVARRVK